MILGEKKRTQRFKFGNLRFGKHARSLAREKRLASSKLRPALAARTWQEKTAPSPRAANVRTSSRTRALCASSAGT